MIKSSSFNSYPSPLKARRTSVNDPLQSNVLASLSQCSSFGQEALRYARKHLSRCSLPFERSTLFSPRLRGVFIRLVCKEASYSISVAETASRALKEAKIESFDDVWEATIGLGQRWTGLQSLGISSHDWAKRRSMRRPKGEKVRVVFARVLPAFGRRDVPGPKYLTSGNGLEILLEWVMGFGGHFWGLGI